MTQDNEGRVSRCLRPRSPARRAKDLVEHPALDPDATFLVLDHEDEEGVRRPAEPARPGRLATAMTDGEELPKEVADNVPDLF